MSALTPPPGPNHVGRGRGGTKVDEREVSSFSPAVTRPAHPRASDPALVGYQVAGSLVITADGRSWLCRPTLPPRVARRIHRLAARAMAAHTDRSLGPEPSRQLYLAAWRAAVIDHGAFMAWVRTGGAARREAVIDATPAVIAAYEAAGVL